MNDMHQVERIRNASLGVLQYNETGLRSVVSVIASGDFPRHIEEASHDASLICVTERVGHCHNLSLNWKCRLERNGQRLYLSSSKHSSLPGKSLSTGRKRTSLSSHLNWICQTLVKPDSSLCNGKTP